MTIDKLISIASRFSVLGIVIFTAMFLIGPLCVLALMSFSDSRFLIFPPPDYSFRWYVEYFTSASWRDATLVSLILATTVSVISTAIGTCAAIAFSRSRFAGRDMIQTVIMSPLFVPNIILAVGLYSVYSIVKLNGTMVGLVLGHLVLTIPYAMVVIGTSLAEFDQRLEQAAQGLGASPLRAFRHVTLPAISSGMATALLFTFLISFDEVVLAVFLSSPTTSTISKLMWDGIRFDLNPTIAAVSTLITGFSWFLMLIGLLAKKELEKRRHNNQSTALEGGVV